MTFVDRLKSKTKRLRAFLPALIVLVIVIAFIARQEKDNAVMVSTPDLSTHPIYSKYDFGDDDRIIDFGTQPLYVPTNFIIEVMKRDAVLKRTLAEHGLEIRYHPFLKGDDVNFFLGRGHLEAAIGGDMPALSAAVRFNVVIVSLTQYGFCSVVAKRHMLMKDLRGKRIGYPFGSNAHYALLQAMSSAGLSETDVRLMPFDVNEMPDALNRGTIDAFAAWEPTPSIALTRFQAPVIIHRSLSSAYLYFSDSFADRHPSAVRQIVAAEMRAINWMKHRTENILEAGRWALQAGTSISGQAPGLSAEQYVALAESDLLGLSSPPFISEKDLTATGRLFRELEFLKRLHKISSTADWQKLRMCFDRTILDYVLSRRQEYQLETFEYHGTLGPSGRGGDGDGPE